MKLSFLIPTYNANEHLEKNFKMWKELSSVVELIFVEDNIKADSKELVEKIGGRYYSKPNGNWGSVINYARKNELISTEYMAVVDPDDLIDIKELKELIGKLREADIFVTNQITRHVTEGWTKLDKVRNNIFVHYSWFKTKIFYEIDDLPEGIPYTDTLIMQNILGYSNSIEFIDLAPYIYNVGFPNQSMAIKWERLKSLEGKLKEFKTYSDKVRKSKVLWKYQKRSEISAKYVFYFLMLNCYAGESKANRKEIVRASKYIRWFRRPITTWLIWLRLNLLFKR